LTRETPDLALVLEADDEFIGIAHETCATQNRHGIVAPAAE
jgi:hypothetical protein